MAGEGAVFGDNSGVIFLISPLNHMLWVFIRGDSRGACIEYP